jgi:hypothetical protein
MVTHFTHLNQVLRKEVSYGQEYSHVCIFKETHEICFRKYGIVEEVSSWDIKKKEEIVQFLSRIESPLFL